MITQNGAKHARGQCRRHRRQQPARFDQPQAGARLGQARGRTAGSELRADRRSANVQSGPGKPSASERRAVQGFGRARRRFADRVAEHNRSVPAVLKNAIDWGTRPYGHNSWAGKGVAIVGTSPGAIGTAIAQQHLRNVLGNLGALVMAGEAYVTFKPGLIDEAETVTDAGTRRFLQSFIEQFAGFAARLTPTAHAAAA